jgi:hypothetical protein
VTHVAAAFPLTPTADVTAQVKAGAGVGTI